MTVLLLFCIFCCYPFPVNSRVRLKKNHLCRGSNVLRELRSGSPVIIFCSCLFPADKETTTMMASAFLFLFLFFFFNGYIHFSYHSLLMALKCCCFFFSMPVYYFFVLFLPLLLVRLAFSLLGGSLKES